MGSRGGLRSVAALLALVMAGEVGAWSGEAGIGHDSNVANVREGGRERDDQFLQLAVGTDSLWPLTENAALQWRLQVDAQQFAQQQALSNAQAMLQARWLFRPAAGFYAPLLETQASAAWWEFDSRLRDSAQYRFGLFATEQLTTTLSLRAGWRVNWRRGHSAVFDADTRSLSLDLDWLPLPALTVYSGYQHLDGDLVSTAVSVPAFARAAAPDDAFAGESAFRLSSRAHVVTLGGNYALTSQLALDLQARQVRARADAGPHYERTQLLASLLWRY